MFCYLTFLHFFCFQHKCFQSPVFSHEVCCNRYASICSKVQISVVKRTVSHLFINLDISGLADVYFAFTAFMTISLLGTVYPGSSVRINSLKPSPSTMFTGLMSRPTRVVVSNQVTSELISGPLRHLMSCHQSDTVCGCT